MEKWSFFWKKLRKDLVVIEKVHTFASLYKRKQHDGAYSSVG